MFNRVSIPELAIFSFILWLLNSKVPGAFLLIVIVLMGFVFGRPFVPYVKKTAPDGKTKISIVWMDFVGLFLIVCVVYALAQRIHLEKAMDIAYSVLR